MQLNKEYFHFIFALFCLVFPSGRRRKGEYSRRRNVYINFSGKHINKHSFKWFYLHTFVSNDSYRMTWQIFCRMFINNCFSSSYVALDIQICCNEWDEGCKFPLFSPPVIFVQLSSLPTDCCCSTGFNHHNHLLKLQEQCWVLLLSDDLQPKLRQFIPSQAVMKPDICCSEI